MWTLRSKSQPLTPKVYGILQPLFADGNQTCCIHRHKVMGSNITSCCQGESLPRASQHQRSGYALSLFSAASHRDTEGWGGGGRYPRRWRTESCTRCSTCWTAMETGASPLQSWSWRCANLHPPPPASTTLLLTPPKCASSPSLPPSRALLGCNARGGKVVWDCDTRRFLRECIGHVCESPKHG
jgi:hypothetical protein